MIAVGNACILNQIGFATAQLLRLLTPSFIGYQLKIIAHALIMFNDDDYYKFNQIQFDKW